ncbi:helix-turn-helix domain-containing protein [Zobellia sp. B3R18]|uniref:helix-turn-helix domain-containing protein n=1 Tax=Zobellia sp. B3R18 TaxID=2841568 RepID=UPI001C06B629|nr:helix-turn-helix domain-containing protein [Zobellia sp. B3R18]MBU2974990.1 helix-turn-helix domain-containing protein [Zobellia sp. B3R18]
MDAHRNKYYQIVPETHATDIISGVVKAMTPLLDRPKERLTDNNEELLTVEETLKFLKCSKQALWNWRKNGILPSYRLGNRVYYKKSDIFAKLIKQE